MRSDAAAHNMKDEAQITKAEASWFRVILRLDFLSSMEA
jgi:hypothetical protein